MNDVTGTPQSNRKVSWFFPSSAAIRLVAIKLLTLTLTLVAALWVWPTPTQAQGPVFHTMRTFGGLNDTRSMAVGDVNGDGFLDIVEGNYGQNYVYLNDRTGRFRIAVPFGSANTTDSVALGDLNGDGFLDIIEGNWGQPMYVYLNDGQGNFPTAAPFGSANYTISIAVGDVNGDGFLDIVEGNDGQNNVYLNDGQGNFPTAAPFGGADFTSSVAVGDLNGDGFLDIVEGNDGQNNVYLNDGQGNFPTTASFGSANSTTSMAVGDFNGDGFLDIVEGNNGQNNVYLNDGLGNFPNAVPFGGVTGTFSAAVGDLNGDGFLDIVEGNWGQNNVYLNDGQGDFPNAAPLGGADFTSGVGVGDLDGDGYLDIVEGNGGQNRLYLNDAMGGFPTAAPFGSFNNTWNVAVGDVNGDGFLDVVEGNWGRNNVYLDDGQGNFPTAAPFGSANSTTSVAVGDVNGDGFLDIVEGNWGQPMYLNLNDGQGNFPTATPLGGADFTEGVAVGDLNGDGFLDIVEGKNGQNNVYLNDGQGNFPSVAPFGIGDFTSSVAVGDLNGDGFLDIVEGKNGQNNVYLNDGQGNFPSAAPFGIGNFTESVAVGDVNGDGFLDIVEGNSEEWNNVYLNDGLGNFPNAVPFGGVNDTRAVTLGDLNGDGFLDIVEGNYQQSHQIYLNNRSGSFPTAFSFGGFNISSSVGVGDFNGDGFPDIVEGSHAGQGYIYINRLRQAVGLANNAPYLSITRPITTGNANFYSTPVILESQMIPLTYTVFDPEGDHVGRVAAFYSLNGGDNWQPAVATPDTFTTNLATGPYPTPTLTNTHIYTWDTFASGFFGQSDNVVLRLVAYPQPPASASPGTYRYPNTVAGPYQWPSASATTFPFRVRGTQVQVLSGTVPISNALVYRLPEGQTSGGFPLADGSGIPFQTNNQGYLPGRGRIDIDDRLLALIPVTATDSYTLYYTSAAPTEAGLEAHVVTQPGVQTLTVSATNPLLLFNLDVSLEWDASNDPSFRALLQQNLAKTSAALYDWTNGQAALGRVTVYQAKEQWDEADIRIFASNQMRPIANRGGIVTETTVLIHPDLTEPITATQGEIRIGPTWNRYGDATPIGDDWPRVLAHELGHYALFLEDTYLTLDENGLLVPSGCEGTAMSDPYSDSYSEFSYQMNCDSLAELPDWELIRLAYPELNSPPPANSGPTIMPFAFTQIEIRPAPTSSLPLLDDNNVPVPEALKDGRAYLIHPGQNLVDLGRPALDSVLARGARQEDEVCVFAAADFACSGPLSNSAPPQLTPVSAWLPEVLLTPVNTTSLQIEVNNAGSGPLTATFYPNGVAPQTVMLTPGQTQTINLTQAAAEVWVDLKGSEPNQRLITGYAIGAGPGRTRGHGGPGRTRGHGGPFASGDGSMLIYPPETLAENDFMVLQLATTLPPLPPELTPIGRAYQVRPSATVADFSGASLTFQYLGLEVLLAGGPQVEDSLAVHYWHDDTWIRLETILDQDQNFASAPLPGAGLYVLTAGKLGPEIGGVSPASGTSGLTHTLTITGLNFLAPLSATLVGDSGSYPLTIISVAPQTATVETPPGLPADLYDLELANAGGLTTTKSDAFALYTTPSPGTCFFDDFKSGLGRWTVTGEWGVVNLADGREAVTDSPGHPYLSAEEGSTLTTSLTSQSFNLAACANPILTFQHDYRLAIGPAQFQDWGVVEISLDDGATWQPLDRYTGGGSYGPVATAVDEWPQVQWQPVALNLAAANVPTNATTVRLRFNLTVDAEGSDKGWIFDEVRVGGEPSARLYLPVIVK